LRIIHYDPERILNGFTEESLKDIAKRLKRKIRLRKSDVIQDILSPSKGKSAEIGKVWQEINRSLRKELEAFSPKEIEIFSLIEIPREEQFKASYMFTLSSNPEIRAMGEKLYCQAQEIEVLENDEYKGGEEESDHKDLQKDKVKEDLGEELGDEKLGDDELGDEEALAVFGGITPELETSKVKESTHTRDEELITAKDEIELIEQIEASVAIGPIVREVRRSIEVLEVGTKQAKRVEGKSAMINNVSNDKIYSRLQGTVETSELQKRIKTLEKKLRKIYSEGLSTKGQLENLKNELTALSVQLVKEKGENERYRNRVQELESELIGKDKEIELLKKKLEQLQYNTITHIRAEQNAKLDLAAFQGRKALIFAEHNNEVDNRLNTLGIIPIWAMEIDWNRPRRRMSTCQIVLYKRDDEKLKKLEEIREIARYLNVPCSELLDVVGGSDDQR